ncbi:MAG: DMT family transporter [Maritimibacter sp.]
MENARPQPRPLTGVLWMLVTGLNFVMVNVLVKLVGGRLPAPESAFLRFLLGLVFLIPMIKPLIATQYTRGLIAMFAARGAAHAVGVMLWFYAMAHLPIAEVTAINYLNPVFVTLGAALILREKLALRRILAIIVALIGAMVILRPGMRTIEPGHIAMLATATAFAGSYLLAGRLAGRVSPVVVVAMLSITVPIALAPFALANWITPQPMELVWLFATAGFATTGHYTMTRAFAVAPMTVTQPVTFLQLIWASLIGASFFGEPIDIWVVLGGGLILGSVVFITWREAVLKRRVTPGAGEISLQG